MTNRASRTCVAMASSLLAILNAGTWTNTLAADASSPTDIRDIRGPKSIFPPWLVPALFAAGTTLAIGGTYAAWRRLRRRHAPPTLQPFEIALQQLEDIQQLMDPTRAKEFSTAISDIVRQYIEAGLKITVTHRTTEEFLHELLTSSKSALAAHRDLLMQFLQQCDLVKFAGVSLSKPIMESLHRSARAFVTETSKPVSQPLKQSKTHDSLPAT